MISKGCPAAQVRPTREHPLGRTTEARAELELAARLCRNTPEKAVANNGDYH